MRASLALLVMTVAMYVPLAAHDQSCSVVTSTPSQSVALLEAQKHTRQSPCITVAIKQLGEEHDASAVPVLVSYLDFVDPATQRAPDGPADVRPRYPAVDALFKIGKPATGELLLAIQARGSSDIRENAVNAYMAVYRDDLAAGIRVLKKERSVATSADARRRLSDALRLLINDCNGRGEQERQSCEAAAHQK